MFQYLNDIDTQLTLFINSLHASWLDEPMYWLSDKLVWIPFYAFLAYLIIKKYGTRSWELFIIIAVIIALCDQTASHLIKPLVQRLRPCHEPGIASFIHLSKKGCGGDFGFVSSHAANALGMAVFIHLMLHKKWLTYTVYMWAFLVAYSRIYNGVHYVGDVLVGALIGVLYASIICTYYQRYCQKKGR